MAQDLRDLLKEEEKFSGKMPAGHQKRFEDRLEEALPQKNSSRTLYLKIAAVLIVALGVGFFFFYQGNDIMGPQMVGTEVEEKEIKEGENPSETGASPTQVTLGDISPEFKKVENYYLASLNLGISNLNITDENKALIDAFMAQLGELDKEYARLNTELNEHGPNEEIVQALINNLQLRLDLLFKLKNKLDELKNERNEKFENQQV